MRVGDAATMAFHNLICRKRRTILNLVGVVIGCTMLLLTLAGTRGVSSGIQNMVNNIEEARRIVIYASWKPTTQPPEELLDIQGEMSDERRERLVELVKENWLAEFGDRQLLNDELLDEIANVEHVVEVTPSHSSFCHYDLLKDGQQDDKQAGYDGYSSAVSLTGDALEKSILVGQRIAPDDQAGVLLSEFAAYRLGFVDDGELAELVGRKIRVHWVATDNPAFGLLRYFAPEDGTNLLSNLSALSTFEQLLDEIDMTNLTEEQQDLIRGALSAVSREGTTESSDVGSAFISRDLIVRGVIKREESMGLSDIINVVSGHTESEVLVHPELSRQIRTQLNRESHIYNALARVDSLEPLEEVVAEIESRGVSTHSAVWILGTIREQINNILLVIAGLSCLVLLITAMAIFNAMTVSVVERAPEFGIMKSLGADSRDLLTLMLFEGAATGMLAAIVSLVVSSFLVWTIGYAVRSYVGFRLNEIYTEPVFVFAWYDLVLVIAIAVAVCVMASMLPAFRAARLEPIITMRRT